MSTGWRCSGRPCRDWGEWPNLSSATNVGAPSLRFFPSQGWDTTNPNQRAFLLSGTDNRRYPYRRQKTLKTATFSTPYVLSLLIFDCFTESWFNSLQPYAQKWNLVNSQFAKFDIKKGYTLDEMQPLKRTFSGVDAPFKRTFSAAAEPPGPTFLSSFQRAYRNRLDGSSEKICPSRICTTRCAYSAISGSCVTSTIVFPLACRLSNRAMISVPVFESRFPVGSSARMIEIGRAHV